MVTLNIFLFSVNLTGYNYNNIVSLKELCKNLYAHLDLK